MRISSFEDPNRGVPQPPLGKLFGKLGNSHRVLAQSSQTRTDSQLRASCRQSRMADNSKFEYIYENGCRPNVPRRLNIKSMRQALRAQPRSSFCSLPDRFLQSGMPNALVSPGQQGHTKTQRHRQTSSVAWCTVHRGSRPHF